MTVNNVSNGSAITTTWGDSVADDTNANTAAIAAEVSLRTTQYSQLSSGIQTNADEIGDNTNLINANESARNEDFVMGTSPRIIATGSTSRIYLRSPERPMLETITGADVAEMYSNRFYFGAASSNRTLTTTPAYITGAECNPGETLMADSKYALDYTVDFQCTSDGTAVAYLYRSINSGAYNLVSEAPQIIAAMKAGDRMTLSQSWVDTFGVYNNLNYRLYAEELSGAFTAGAQHTNMRLISFL